jgi:hypothetical protein
MPWLALPVQGQSRSAGTLLECVRLAEAVVLAGSVERNRLRWTGTVSGGVRGMPWLALSVQGQSRSAGTSSECVRLQGRLRLGRLALSSVVRSRQAKRSS